MVRRIKDVDLERLIEENSELLKNIMSSNEIILFDTCTLLRIGKGYKSIIDNVKEGSIFNKDNLKSFKYYNDYLKILLHNIKENKNNFTAPEIVEEIDVVKIILSNKMKNAIKYMKREHVKNENKNKIYQRDYRFLKKYKKYFFRKIV